MYNGIGLTTPRGSGTNGYVQRNLSFVTNSKEKTSYKDENDSQKRSFFKEPNVDILLHEKKRKVEVKCFELQLEMENQGYTESEITEKVDSFRKTMLSELYKKEKTNEMALIPSSTEESQSSSKGTHELRHLTKLKNDVFKGALGINPEFEDGTSFEVAAKRRKEAEVLREAQEKLKTVESSDTDEEKEKKKKKKAKKSKSKKHKHHDESKSSDSDDDRKHKKQRKKHKKDKKK